MLKNKQDFWGTLVLEVVSKREELGWRVWMCRVEVGWNESKTVGIWLLGEGGGMVLQEPQVWPWGWGLGKERVEHLERSSRHNGMWLLPNCKSMLHAYMPKRGFNK